MISLLSRTKGIENIYMIFKKIPRVTWVFVYIWFFVSRCQRLYTHPKVVWTQRYHFWTFQLVLIKSPFKSELLAPKTRKVRSTWSGFHFFSRSDIFRSPNAERWAGTVEFFRKYFFVSSKIFFSEKFLFFRKHYSSGCYHTKYELITPSSLKVTALQYKNHDFSSKIHYFSHQ